MGVTIMQGDIFTTQAQVIGHGVNTQGLMGNGVARTIRIMYPSVFKAYQQACDDGTLYARQLGWVLQRSCVLCGPHPDLTFQAWLPVGRYHSWWWPGLTGA